MGRKIVTKVTAEKGYLNAKMVHGWWMTTEELHSTNSVIVAIERTKNRAAATAEGLICVSGWRANNEVDAHNNSTIFNTRRILQRALSTSIPKQLHSAGLCITAKQWLWEVLIQLIGWKCSLLKRGRGKNTKKTGRIFFPASTKTTTDHKFQEKTG